MLLYLPLSWIIHGLLFFESSTRGELFLKESGKKKKDKKVNSFYWKSSHFKADFVVAIPLLHSIVNTGTRIIEGMEF